jgi:hypothetical protein
MARSVFRGISFPFCIFLANVKSALSLARFTPWLPQSGLPDAQALLT